MSPLAFFEQLADTPWSMALHESDIAYSILESTHVWSLVLFFGLVIVFDLRLLGWAFQKVPVSEFSRRLLPWTVLGFVLMVIGQVRAPGVFHRRATRRIGRPTGGTGRQG